MLVEIENKRTNGQAFFEENSFEIVRFIYCFVSLCVLCLNLRGFIGLRKFVRF